MFRGAVGLGDNLPSVVKCVVIRDAVMFDRFCHSSDSNYLPFDKNDVYLLNDLSLDCGFHSKISSFSLARTSLHDVCCIYSNYNGFLSQFSSTLISARKLNKISYTCFYIAGPILSKYIFDRAVRHVAKV